MGLHHPYTRYKIIQRKRREQGERRSVPEAGMTRVEVEAEKVGRGMKRKRRAV